MEHSNPILMGNNSPQKFITIGEVMLRLTPPNYEKIRMTSTFEASYGGSEANIALALANLGVDSTFSPPRRRPPAIVRAPIILRPATASAPARSSMTVCTAP